MAEGGGLLNRYRTKSSIGGSNPPLSASFFWNPLKTCKLMTMQVVMFVGHPRTCVQISQSLHFFQPVYP